MISPSAISPLNRRFVEGQEPFSFGNALQFDGVNDYVVLNTFFEISNQRTISAWVNQISIFNGMLFGNTVNSDYILLNNATNIQVILGGVLKNFTTSTRTQNTWYNYVFVYNSGVVDLYINGSFVAQQTGFSTSNLNYFGRWRSAGFYLNGKLDEVAVWNTALSSSDIANLYNSGTGDYATNYSSANLLRYYRLNGSGSDTLAIDETGNANGTLTNFSRPPEYWVAH